MGRKRINKQKSPLKQKKLKTSTHTIESLFKRTDQSNDGNPSTEQSSDCELTLDKANICGRTDVDSIVEIIDEWINTEEGTFFFVCSVMIKRD